MDKQTLDKETLELIEEIADYEDITVDEWIDTVNRVKEDFFKNYLS